MGKEKAAGNAGGVRGPRLTPATEAARRARAAKLADALRENLGRRKADLTQRQEGAPDRAETGNPAKRR